MTFLHAIIFGVVEGITEFLPVSSTGHLILTGRLLGLPTGDFLKTFEIVIQLGAILAVLTLYGKMLLRKPGILTRLAVACVPTGISGFFLYPLIKGWLGNTSVVLWALGLGGAVLILFEKLVPEPADASEDIARLSYRTALIVGVAQSVAIVPGVSRAAATIVGGLLAGMSRRAIVEFSFLLALPTMAAATLFDISKNMGALRDDNLGLLAVGFLTAWLTALVAIRWLLRFIRSHDFTLFGVYRIILALVVWLVLM